MSVTVGANLFPQTIGLVHTMTSMDSQPLVTEVVRVPSVEHVAQIVGRSGSKIKYLRAETNTCIKTPYRGDDPAFVVTGRPDSVRMAVNAIEKASQHFSYLMDGRSNVCAVGEVTISVTVPQPYVGAVVGRNGSVIKTIKEQTNTRINTPKSDAAAPAFEVTGTRVNVLAAKEAIGDKVLQAYQLRNSTKFDPNLNRSKFMDKIFQSSSPPMTAPVVLMSTQSPIQSSIGSVYPMDRGLSPKPSFPVSSSIFDPFFYYKTLC
ncbi:unnamed protein product [Medioppia subpectinata]|uniref:K Homology domain-containing protein n=1 Tax=Medioppia subpectinata TaxID=1979941 RepID=A0A7R9KRU9_9ACAR|nr:unnamed protein product [Medioppia subpectinata]CAG2108692.1 unnamed protein product [Medioppia subpectinata]